MMLIMSGARYPVNKSSLGAEPTYLSYQTLTIDLYAPLLLLVLLLLATTSGT